jgi:hypothetical protein
MLNQGQDSEQALGDEIAALEAIEAQFKSEYRQCG